MRKLIVIVFLLIVFACLSLNASPLAHDVVINSPSCEMYDKCEITFQVDTTSKYLFWPYDPNPAANTLQHPNAVPAGLGVSVDGLFLPPGQSNWANAIVQPAFYFQEYQTVAKKVYGTKDYFAPVGFPCWKIRFTPKITGNWQYRIRIVDSTGNYMSNTGSFNCVSSTKRGFVRISSNDPRYFETSDGQCLNLVGLSDNVKELSDMDVLYSTYSVNKINLIRPWWQGSQQPVLFGLTGQGGSSWAGNFVLTGEAARPGGLISGKITSNTECFTGAFVKPSTTYRFAAWVKTVNVTGTGSFGVYLVSGGEVTERNVRISPIVNGTTDWTEISGDLHTTSVENYILPWLKVKTENMTGGTVYFADVSLKEVLPGGALGPELISQPSFNCHNYVSQLEAWKADYQTELCRTLGIYLKVCLQEKADAVYGGIQADGTFTATASSDNVYAGNDHASRTYQQYFWRYIIARYGYATSIHSFEFCNEGDPFSGNHANAVQAMGTYFNTCDPNKHLVTTSNWHSYPVSEMWSTCIPSVSNIYSDWHMYVGDQTGKTHYTVPVWNTYTGVDCQGAPSSPKAGYVSNPTGALIQKFSMPIAVTPSHRYTITWKQKGLGLTTVGAQNPVDCRATLRIDWQFGWQGDFIDRIYATDVGVGGGTYNWISKTWTAIAPFNAVYMTIALDVHYYVGECWWDNIVVHDDTAGQYIDILGNFDYNLLTEDSASINKNFAVQIGYGSSRVVKAPMIVGEIGITSDNLYGNPYKGYLYSGEHQGLVDDSSGIWYRKLTWSQILPENVIDMYWFRELIAGKNLYKYAKAYQTFMADIPLNNGQYRDAQATTTNSKIRAWGQKDLTNNRAHLWIDNAPYTWKAVVDHNYTPEPWSSTATYALNSTCGSGSPVRIYKSLQNTNTNHPVTSGTWWQDMGAFDPNNNPALPAPVSGTVTISGFKDGVYMVRWYDTSSGLSTNDEYLNCAGGNIQMTVSNLVSDIACKIMQAPGRIVVTPVSSSTNVIPGQSVTVTVNFRNDTEFTVSNVRITANVPSELDYTLGSAESTGGSYNSVGRNVSWLLGTLQPHASGSKTYQGKIK